MKDGWEYRWGDSPFDANGTPIWTREKQNSDWKPVYELMYPPDRDGRDHVWYRNRLPSGDWKNAVLFLPTVILSFEVYVDTTMVYRFGDLRSTDRDKYSVSTEHLLPLPSGYQGEYVWLRIFSNTVVIGMDPPMVGTEVGIVDELLREGLATIWISGLLIFIGLFSLLTFLLQIRSRFYYILTFAVFTTALGLYYILEDGFIEFMLDAPIAVLYFRVLSFLTFPVAMYMFMESMMTSKRVIRALWMIHLGAGIVVVLLDVIGKAPLPATVSQYNILFVATIPVALIASLREARRGNWEARILLYGFSVFAVSGILDLAQGLGWIQYFRWMSQYGMFVFVVCIGYLLQRRFTESKHQLRIYSDQLKAYSRNLEEMVHERTHELQTTLAELKDTQQQLVLREKMASLGNLVAGVAHEINNPVGAMGSAADVSSRVIDKLDEYIEKHGDDNKPKKALSLLRDNNEVISIASARISEIVKSLKNFSRLDEAELQTADVHEGIDSTLTLIRHRHKGRIEIVKDYGDVPPLTIYPNQLNQVFMNLLINAMDALGDSGRIVIKTWADEHNAIISISDNGPGIAADNLESIFDPGFTTKGVGVGTGLGLSISYKIVEKHGGKLSVTSGPGKGATFTIVLPLKSR